MPHENQCHLGWAVFFQRVSENCWIVSSKTLQKENIKKEKFLFIIHVRIKIVFQGSRSLILLYFFKWILYPKKERHFLFTNILEITLVGWESRMWNTWVGSGSKAHKLWSFGNSHWTVSDLISSFPSERRLINK